MLKELEFFLKRIPESGLLFKTQIASRDIDLEYPGFVFNLPIKLDLKIDLVDKEILVIGSVETLVDSTCARCLKEIQIPLNICELIIDYENKGQDVIDISPDIRDEIIIALPKKILCDENCKGLCPGCKVDLNKEVCKCEKKSFGNPFADL